jgi:hypothetical protein
MTTIKSYEDTPKGSVEESPVEVSRTTRTTTKGHESLRAICTSQTLAAVKRRMSMDYGVLNRILAGRMPSVDIAFAFEREYQIPVASWIEGRS